MIFVLSIIITFGIFFFFKIGLTEVNIFNLNFDRVIICQRRDRVLVC
jgi:hypothetical protein